MKMFYAHSVEGKPVEEWQLLEEHLKNVADMAAGFADHFGASEWGRCAGFLHDAGKATGAFQHRLEGDPAKVDHLTYGARLAQEKAGRLGLLLSYVVAGHHGGLPDGGAQEKELHYRLKHGKVPGDVELLPIVKCQNELTLPFKLNRNRAGFALSFFTRMIFSCLVDGDFLDTELFCSPEKANCRPVKSGSDLISKLQKKHNLHMLEVSERADLTSVNLLRSDVLAQCMEKAKLPQQIFSLTVPTGGGKTLSSLAFALDHAVKHGLRRIIYAIPFTSIIEQNAEVFQEILGREQVLGHHCNFKERDEPEEANYNQRRGLATENWDAPVVVTTNVQFFESLFSNKTSRCRKLHNISRSVIVLDEAQAIPTEYLEPCLAALRELIDNYGCSIVLCTATQPALDDESNLSQALPEINEIIDNPSKLFEGLCRTEVIYIGPITNAKLTACLEKEKQVLCVVSTKPHAKELFKKLQKKEGVFHLSTNMYPQHRRRVIAEIKNRLKEKKSCRVVSTSLIEAGVDIDFPVVYRALAGLDSIAQAAGRCNREGELRGMNGEKIKGKVFIFEPEKPSRMPWLKRCVSRASETLRSLPDVNPLGIEAIRLYFELLYDVQELDKKQIMSRLNPKLLQSDIIFPFREVANEFRFIEEETIGVIVPIEAEAKSLVKQIRNPDFPRSVPRQLQQYSVGVRTRDYAILDKAGALEVIHGEVPVLCNLKAYSKDVGLCVDEGEVWKSEELIT